MNRLSLTAALALATLTSTPAAARGTATPTTERETRSSERPTRASSSAESTRSIARIAAAMASSDDFGTLVSARTQSALDRYPTQSRVEAATIEAAESIIAQTGITDPDILFMILKVLIEAEIDPVGLTSALIASNLGCTEAEDCIDLGEMVLSMSTVVDQACYDGGTTRLTECKDLATSEIKWVMEAAYAAELEHLKDIEQTIHSGLDTASGPEAGGAGGSLGLLTDCGVIDEGTGSDPLAPAYADTCTDFGPAGDPAFLVVDEATVTPVSPFFDSSSSCYGLNPGMLFTSDGGGSGDWLDVSLTAGAIVVAVAAAATAPITLPAAAITAAGGVIFGATTAKSHIDGDYDVLYDALSPSSSTSTEVEPVYTDYERYGANSEGGGQIDDEDGNEVEDPYGEDGRGPDSGAMWDKIAAAAAWLAEKESSSTPTGTDYDLEGSMASCSEELSASFGECVPSATSGGGATDYAASVVSDAEGTDCGIAQICSSPVLAELAVYATLCGVWDPSPIDQGSSLSELGSGSLMIDCETVGGPDCGSPWDTETADQVSDCLPGVDCPDDL